MRNFTLTIILLAISCGVYANHSDEIPSPNIADFKYPATGVFIVKPSEIQIPEELRRKIELNRQQMISKGYYDSDAPDAQHLLAMKNMNIIALQNRGEADIKNFKNTTMKPNIANVGLAFHYSGLPMIKKENIIGFAAGGMWIDDKGWTGSKEFFNHPELGICTFTLFNMALAHGNVRIGEDSVRYDVNKKAGTNEVYGNKQTGFTYNVSWYDKTYSHELECASLEFNSTLLSKMLIFSNEIDTSISKELV